MKIKAKELKQKSQDELKMMLKENREKVRSLRFDLASKKLKKTNELGEVRKSTAQILTVLNKK